MEISIETLTAVTSIAIPLILLVAWFIRLEMRTKANHDAIRTLEIAVGDIKTHLNSFGERLSGIEAKLDFLIDNIKSLSK